MTTASCGTTRIFNIGVSVGLVEISRESGTLEELLAAADSACYVAKKQGSGRVAVYSARDEALARHTGEIQWLQRLQSALKENRFHLYHQVIVPAHGEDGGPAMEVLVRLQDESGNDLPPSEFMRAAERYRLMGLVDRWVVQTTLAALGRGAILVAHDRSVAINISGQTLGDAQFLEFVVECLDNTGVAPAQVCFEITESAVIANLDHARRFVGVLHGMGCQFALDDFGSGVGSFSNLKNLPLDYLKIDGSFMRNLSRDTVNQAMVDRHDQAGTYPQLQGDRRAGGGHRRGRDRAAHGRRLPAGLRDRAAAAAAAGRLRPPRGGAALALFRLELQRHAIHAVALAARLRAVGKHVAEVAAAARTVHLGAAHEVAAVLVGPHRPGHGPVEARPARAAFVLGVRLKELLAAAGAAEHAAAVLLVERAGAGALGAMMRSTW